MKRSFFKVATVLSLLLVIAPGVLWVRSRTVDEGLVRLGDHGFVAIDSHSGALAIRWSGRTAKDFPHRLVRYRSGVNRVSLSSMIWLPYFATSGEGTALVIPYWIILLAAAILPALWLRRRRKRSGRGFPIQASEQSASGQTLS